jgi:hypothetical protein
MCNPHPLRYFDIFESTIARIGSLTQKPCNACDFRISSRAMMEWITPTLLIATAAVAQQTHNQYEPPNVPGARQRLLALWATGTSSRRSSR